MSLIRRCNCDMNNLFDRNTMNQTLKFIGLLAILPLVMVAIVPDYIGEADATTQYSKGTPNQSFGSADSPVCGGFLCDESTENTGQIKLVSNEEPKVDPPLVGMISLYNFSGGFVVQ